MAATLTAGREKTAMHTIGTQPIISPLILSDHLITLAQTAERAGLAVTAGHLVILASAVFDEAPARRLPPR